MLAAAAFVLAVVAVVVAGHVAGPFTAPLAVAVLCAGRVGARWPGRQSREAAA